MATLYIPSQSRTFSANCRPSEVFQTAHPLPSESNSVVHHSTKVKDSLFVSLARVLLIGPEVQCKHWWPLSESRIAASPVFTFPSHFSPSHTGNTSSTPWGALMTTNSFLDHKWLSGWRSGVTYPFLPRKKKKKDDHTALHSFVILPLPVEKTPLQFFWRWHMLWPSTKIHINITITGYLSRWNHNPSRNSISET